MNEPKVSPVEKFKCTQCGAFLIFDAGKQVMKCNFCGSEKLIESNFEKFPEEKDFFSAPSHTGWAAEMSSIKCESCGATSTSIERSGVCAFCSSPYIKTIPTNTNIIRPENLIPFKIDKNRAMQLFRTWIGKGFFRPSNLKKLGNLESLKGVYIPFWTYDCLANSNWTAQSGYYYYETERYTTYEQGRRVTRTRQVRKVRWVPSFGHRNDFYNDKLIVASRGLDYHLVLKIYPFNLGSLVPYKPEYLSGWLAEDYSVNLQEGWEIAKNQVVDEQQARCARDVPGDTYRFLHVNTSFSKITYKHILLPIWLASYTYNKKQFHFLINGQTGELEGYAPISWFKVAGVVALIAGIVSAVIYCLMIL
jgi:hypothetical protein